MADRIEQAETYTHPETGESVEIPAGSAIERNADGDILYWQLPPETPEGERHEAQVPDYEPQLERQSFTRRVLQHITDEDHVDRGPRNTTSRLRQELAEDANSRGTFGRRNDVQTHLDQLQQLGLVVKREDGTWAVTDEGLVELRN